MGLGVWYVSENCNPLFRGFVRVLFILIVTVAVLVVIALIAD
jgi:hypothetical protein